MKLSIAVAVLFSFSSLALSDDVSDEMIELLSTDHTNQIVIDIEAALARAQAELGIIPKWAAQEITAKADISFASSEDIAKEYDVVRHRMVALLNVWGRSMDNDANQWLHYGATTVDIYDSTLAIQLNEASLLLITALEENERILTELATQYRDTPMMGRTLGQQALPVTAGKVISTWLAANRRDIERLKHTKQKLERHLILKGAVGTYLGFGDNGIKLEELWAKELGYPSPEPSDWHAFRDVFAEYAYNLTSIAGTYQKIANDIMVYGSSEFGEIRESVPASTISSSTMPQKRNPSKSMAIIFAARNISANAQVVFDDRVSFFERDQTGRYNNKLRELSQLTIDMLDNDARRWLNNLEFNEERMLENLQLSGGLIMAQRIYLELAPMIGKENGDKLMISLAQRVQATGESFKDVLLQDKTVSQYLTEDDIDRLLDPTTYIGLAGEEVDRVIAWTQSLSTVIQ